MLHLRGMGRILAVAGCLLLCMAAHAKPAAQVTGRWIFHFVNYGVEFAPARVSLSAEHGAVSGSLNELSIDGQFRDGLLTFKATRPDGRVFGKFEGRFKGDELRGTMTDRGNTALWVMRRLPPASPPTIRYFRPRTFSRTFSAQVDPVIAINPGDTVRTFTLDSGGFDSDGRRLSFGGNPQTGPFYVNGAIPGDTLVVTLKRLALNRDTGRSGTQLLPVTVTPDYYREARYSEGADGEWILDRVTMSGRLAKPGAALRDYRVPLKPFLGGIGVAPEDDQAIGARSLGKFGGNLDYNALTEGATVYLPVLAEGALLYVGDGHAAQGAGELTGDAIETSMDVDFTVDLLPGKTISGPRAEDTRYLMAMGIAGSAAEAIREATTGLARWLESDYGYSAEDIAFLLGTAIQYDIAEIVDPQINVVAKIEKSILTMPRR